MNDLQVKTNITDELGKPDMQAVLSRTHLGHTLHDFLLPTFEAVSNAMHAIEFKLGERSSQDGKINVVFQNSNDPFDLKITISDNGIGLDDSNYKSFRTPFSGFKLKQHGRGFGRFIAFKVFAKIVYKSRYLFFSESKTRSFQFDVSRERELVLLDHEPDFQHSGSIVEYAQPLTVWHDLIRSLSVEEVVDEIGSHFLPYFLYKWLPSISIKFDHGSPQDITTRFKSLFVETSSGSVECNIDGNIEQLHYSITRIPKTRTFKNHCLLFSAADRIVGAARDLSNKLGQPHFVNEEGGRYIVLTVVRGAAFESRLNDARTGLNLAVKDVEGIVSKISDIIQSDEANQIAKIRDSQSTDLSGALRKSYPSDRAEGALSLRVCGVEA